jgi:hypothetical protein
MKRLLRGNTKLDKSVGRAAEFLVSGLTLAPASLSGHEVCNWRGACASSCVLWFAGRHVTDVVRQRAIRQTQFLFRDRAAFESELNRNIARHVSAAEFRDLKPAIRLNVASDLDWSHIAERWPHVDFYDYTKSRQRFERWLSGDWPANYALTFSASERTTPQLWRRYLESGGNVSLVQNVEYLPALNRIGRLQKSITIAGKRFPCVDGDVHDVRLPDVDGRGRVVLLRLKGTNNAKDSARKRGFAVQPGALA